MNDNDKEHTSSVIEEQGDLFSPQSSLLDLPTGRVNDILIEKLENAFHKQTSQVLLHDLAKIAIEHDPIDLAHAVTRLPLSVRHIVYENLPDLPAKMIFMMNVSSNTRTAILRQLSDLEIKNLVEKMPPDEAVAVLEDLPDRRLRRVLEVLEIKKATRIRELLRHARFTAGRLMTNEFFAFPMNTTIGVVTTQIRNNPGIELTRSVFVLNDEGELIGYVPERNLLVNSDHVPLRQVMRPVLHKIDPEASRDEVVDLVERYKISTLPVIDLQNRLLGVITYEDVVEMMEDIADETIANIAGTAEKVTEDQSILKRYFSRAPWLIVTLCAGLVSATGLAYFHLRPWFAIVPFFVPLITGMSGNVGIQCSTIFVRGMATGEISAGTRRETAIRELAIGHLIGITFGILCGLVVYLLNYFGFHHMNIEPVVAAVVVGAGILGACFTATLLGTFSPLFFARMRIDPAVASGPIVTAFNDVLATFMFILVAKIILSQLT
jgi:magnesium transporter